MFAKIESKTDLEIKIEKEKQFKKKINKLASFFREHPHLFAKRFLNVKLKPFQEILLYEMFHNNYVNYVASRGQGKSWITALYAIIKCILYPGSQICVTSKRLKQAVSVLHKIRDDFLVKNEWGSELLRGEIKSVLLNGDEPQIIFHNGSVIYAIAANQNARSKRSTDNIYDEYVQMDPEIIDDVLDPFLNVARQPGFVNNDKYKNCVEDNSIFYLSSPWYKSEWSYLRAKDYFINMIRGKKYFCCALPYQLSIESGLLRAIQILQAYEKSDFNFIKFSMEYGAMWYGSNGKEFFNFDSLKKRRLLTKTAPIFDSKLFKTIKPHELLPNERRILSVDIAIMGGKKNDASVLIINDATLTDRNSYTANINYIKTYEGKRTEELGIIIMRMYYMYGCTDLVIDARSTGIGVMDFITKEQYDSEFDVTYKPFKAINNDDWADKCIDQENCTETLWAMNATAKINTQAAMRLQNVIENNKINLLISEFDCDKYLMNNIKDYDKKSEEIQIQYQVPFIETTLLINELINLEFDIKGADIRLKEKSGMRKDRYSSLAYNIWVMKELEKGLKLKDKENSFNFIMRSPKKINTDEYYYE